MPVTIIELPDQPEASVTDDDILIIWETGAGSSNTRQVTRGELLKDVPRDGESVTFAVIDGDEVNAPVGAIDALTVATSITIGATITKVLKGALALTISTLASDATEDKTATLTGALSGDVVLFSIDSLAAGLLVTAWVSASDTVTFRISNPTGSGITGAAYTARTIAIRAS